MKGGVERRSQADLSLHERNGVRDKLKGHLVAWACHGALWLLSTEREGYFAGALARKPKGQTRSKCQKTGEWRGILKNELIGDDLALKRVLEATPRGGEGDPWGWVSGASGVVNGSLRAP